MPALYKDIAGRIEKVVELDGRRFVLLCPLKKRGPEINVMAFSQDGEFMWELSPPTNTDQWWDGHTNLEVRDGQLWAFSWTCFLRRIDPATGEVLEAIFTK